MPTAAAEVEVQVIQVELEVGSGRRLQWRRESMRVKVALHHETSSIYVFKCTVPTGCKWECDGGGSSKVVKEGGCEKKDGL